MDLKSIAGRGIILTLRYEHHAKPDNPPNARL